MDGTPEAVVVSSPGGGSHELHRPGPGRRGRWECHYYGLTPGDHVLNGIDYAAGPITPQPGDLVGFACWDEAHGLAAARIIAFDPGDPFAGLFAADRAADEARRLLPLDPPSVQLSPPAASAQLVGVPTWLWIDDPWVPLEASATLGGVTATVHATPTGVTWQLGDDGPLTCAGPGTPFDADRPVGEQHSDCTHTFQRRGLASVTATVTYATRWTATTGEGGALEPVTRTTTVAITVAEAQALIR